MAKLSPSRFYYVQYQSGLALMQREIKRVFRVWQQTLLPGIVNALLYLIIFGQIIGKRIGAVGHLHYDQFIIPGLVMLSVINNSFSNVASSFFGAKFGRYIEEILVAPIATTTLIIGYVCGGVVRGCLVGGIVLIIAACFSPIHWMHPGITILVALITALALSLAGLFNALFARRFDDVVIVPTFVLTPLIYLGGVFYNIQSLPPFWQTISLLNPLVYIISAFRYGLYGSADLSITTTMAVLFGLNIILFVTVYRLINRGYGLRS